MLLNISHTTEYAYSTPVQYALQRVRLTPRDNAQQSVRSWQVDIDGGHAELEYLDHLGNHVTLLRAREATNKLVLKATGAVETHDTAGILGHGNSDEGSSSPLWLFQKPTTRTTADRQIISWAEQVHKAGDPVAALHDLSRCILEKVPYQAGRTGPQTTAIQALEIGAGVCQDHAQIFIAAARRAGFPARYVSGYLMMNDRIDQDASHGWAEVHLLSLGWIGFDVSNRISPDERYVRLAVGRDSAEAAPIAGIRLGSRTNPLADETMIVSVQVQQ